MSATKQNNYEIMYIVDDQKPELAAAIKKEFVTILTKDNGKITKEEDFVRQFAYEINHKVQGHYFIMQLLTSAQNIADFDRVFLIKQKQGEVIRKLVINLDEEKTNTYKVKKERPENLNNRGENREFRPRRPYNPDNQTGDNKGRPFNPKFVKRERPAGEKPAEKTTRSNPEVSSKTEENK